MWVWLKARKISQSNKRKTPNKYQYADLIMTPVEHSESHVMLMQIARIYWPSHSKIAVNCSWNDKT